MRPAPRWGPTQVLSGQLLRPAFQLRPASFRTSSSRAHIGQAERAPEQSVGVRLSQAWALGGSCGSRSGRPRSGGLQAPEANRTDLGGGEPLE